MLNDVFKPLKVVIISRTIFPKIAPRAMRATELAKEFARQGHNVILYGKLGKYDYATFERETKIKVKSLGRTLFSRVNSDDTYSYNYFDKLLKKVFGYIIEFPDIELIRNTYFALKDENNIDLLISIAIPYPIHWGVALFRHFNKIEKTTWVADCGDPYCGNPMIKKPFYFHYIERWFCAKTDFISIPVNEAKDAYFPEFSEKIKIIPQGFNFEEINLQGLYLGNKVPTFIYAGVLYPKVRDPSDLLFFLSKVEKDFKFIVYTTPNILLDKFKKVLNDKLEVRDFIPRQELLKVLSKADFLVNFENNTSVQSPSKLIDYALSGRPILSLNSNRELDQQLILDFLDANYARALKKPNLEEFDIKIITSQFIELHNYNFKWK